VELKTLLVQQCLFAFNIDDLVILKAVAAAANQEKVPVIVQLSEGEANFWNLAVFQKAVEATGGKFFLNLDHGRDWSLLQQALELNFSLIHFDGSELEWEENLARTARLVKMAHQRGVLVEGEPQAKLTEPERAAEFVAQTGVDLVAVFVGNRHGMKEGEEERLDFARLRAIKQAVGEKVFLTLHGGSGVALADLRQAIKEKLIAKININTLLRLTYRQVLEEKLKHSTSIKIYQLLAPVQEALKTKIESLLALSEDHGQH